jgi:hypothetical protein
MQNFITWTIILYVIFRINLYGFKLLIRGERLNNQIWTVSTKSMLMFPPFALIVICFFAIKDLFNK